MASSTITVAVDKKGQTQLSVKGTQGQACTMQTKRLQEALGLSIEDEKTEEFYHQPEQTVRVNQEQS